MDVIGKNVLVIGGGGSGIGREIVRRLASNGASVVVADLDESRAKEASDDLNAAGFHTFAVSGDVRDPASLNAMIDSSVRILGRLDVLVTVAGGQVAFVPAVKLHEMADEDWDTIYEINLRYVARAVRKVVQIFLAQDSGGVIISVGSVTGFMAAPQQAAYGVAKAGILSLAKTVAAEYSADGIRMNVVAAGAIATAAAGSESAAGWIDEVPIGRLGRTDEIAEAVLYLASDASSYMTGQRITLDGGVSVRGPFD